MSSNNKNEPDSSEHRQAHAALLQWLREQHLAVMAAEAQALALLEAGIVAGHNEHMQKKAELLANLGEAAKPLLEGLPGEARFNYALALDTFSASASMALRIPSVFYMASLLYPDDHQPGQPDNLKLCIERMESEGLRFR